MKTGRIDKLPFSHSDGDITTNQITRHAHLYRNEILESLFAPEAVVEEEIIEECIKRTYQPNWKRRKAKHGFLSRNATASGRKVNRRRAATGRRISV